MLAYAGRNHVSMNDDLAERILDPGYTPSIRRLGELLELIGGDDDTAKAAERAVLRIESQYASRIAEECVTRARQAERPLRGRLTALAARFGAHDAARGWLFEALGDTDPKTRRAAARGLGKLGSSAESEAALAEAFDRSTNDDDRRVLGEALGKIGGEAARTRAQGRAALMAERDRARGSAGSIDPARTHAGALPIWFHTRSGLEDVLRDELGSESRFIAPGIVEAKLTGPLGSAFAIRTASHVGFPIPSEGESAEAIVQALAKARPIFEAFTGGTPIRFRVAFARGGHQRALVWKVAELVRAELPWLLNDPRASTWEVTVDRTKLELVPRGYDDTRFVYRQDLVAAASSPMIAAALARVAPLRGDDIVWDPFAGSGAELIERARLGPYGRLIGTDIDPRAVEAARANLERAGVSATIEEADACTYWPEGVSLILTNPPMGRRVHRGTHADLLSRFAAHAARALVPGGTLVWLVPAPRPTAEHFAGLRLERAFSVDMGGFSAELLVFRK
jgi:hypothetical protein